MHQCGVSPCGILPAFMPSFSLLVLYTTYSGGRGADPSQGTQVQYTVTLEETHQYANSTPTDQRQGTNLTLQVRGHSANQYFPMLPICTILNKDPTKHSASQNI